MVAVGLLTVEELNPNVGLHEYVAKASLASPIAKPDVFDVQVLVNGVPALTDGAVVLTVTITLAVAEQPFAVVVFVRVYVVVAEGFAVGLLAVDELKPPVGLHKYVAKGSLASPIAKPEVFDVHVLVKSLPALTDVGVVITVTVTLAVAEHPFAVVVFVTV